MKIERREVFKLKDKEGLNKFKEITSNCPKLIQISQNSNNFLKDSEQWINKIQDIMHKSFKKIRITGKGKSKNPEMEKLMKAKIELREQLGELKGQNKVLEKRIRENIDIIEKEMSTICSLKNTNIVKEHFNEITNSDDQVCRLNMWRLKQKLCP